MIAQRIGDIAGWARTHMNLAWLLLGVGQPVEALHHAESAAQVFAQIGHAPLLEATQQLIEQIQSKICLGAFMRAESPDEIRQIAARFPFMVDISFITTIEGILMRQAPPEYRPQVAQKMAVLRQIAYEQK